MSGFSRVSRILSFLAVLPLAAVVSSTGCTCGSGPYEGDYFDGERPGSMAGIKFIESDKGDPKIIGCADGQREGFADLKKHPKIAGCIGSWEGTKSLRDKPTGKPCGDDGEACAVPADVCAEGWHVCGNTGKAKDITDRATSKDCDNAGPGRFNAAVSHSINEEIDPCPKITAATTLPCVQAGLGSEPVCCGQDCLQGKCKDGVWRGKTKISRGTSEGCGSVTSTSNAGVMCCFDGPGNPGDAVTADGGAAADGGAPAADGGEAAAEGGAPAAEGGAPAADGGEAAAEGGEAKAPEGDAKDEAAGDAKGDAPAEKADAKAG